jgi:hypothetical protein
MRHGKVVEAGPAEEIFTAPGLHARPDGRRLRPAQHDAGLSGIGRRPAAGDAAYASLAGSCGRACVRCGFTPGSRPCRAGFLADRDGAKTISEDQGQDSDDDQEADEEDHSDRATDEFQHDDAPSQAATPGRTARRGLRVQ